MTARQYNEYQRWAEDRYYRTADQLLGIDDDWTVNDIEEHLNWLIDNPNEIAEGYDKAVLIKDNIESIMRYVKLIKLK